MIIPRLAKVAGRRLRRRWIPSSPSLRGRWCRIENYPTLSTGSKRSTSPGCDRRSEIRVYLPPNSPKDNVTQNIEKAINFGIWDKNTGCRWLELFLMKDLLQFLSKTRRSSCNDFPVFPHARFCSRCSCWWRRRRRLAQTWSSTGSLAEPF